MIKIKSDMMKAIDNKSKYYSSHRRTFAAPFICFYPEEGRMQGVMTPCWICSLKDGENPVGEVWVSAFTGFPGSKGLIDSRALIELSTEYGSPNFNAEFLSISKEFIEQASQYRAKYVETQPYTGKNGYTETTDRIIEEPTAVAVSPRKNSMKAIVAIDDCGHFIGTIIKDDQSHLLILRELTKQVSAIQYLDDQERAEAYRLAYEGSIEEIEDWLEDSGHFRFGRSGSGRYDIVELSETLPKDFAERIAD
jgi:hypothetical protein